MERSISDFQRPPRAITRGPRHHWFGYHDKLQFDPLGRLALGMAGILRKVPVPSHGNAQLVVIATETAGATAHGSPYKEQLNIYFRHKKLQWNMLCQ
jgi:hypothetical protein